jgi:hypothetical protein
MVTNPEVEEKDQPVVAFERLVREVVSGHEYGAVRRIALYALTFVLVVSPIPQAAVLPLALLAMTDVLA